MDDSLEILTEDAIDSIYEAVHAKGGTCGLDVNHFGELNLVCRWKNRRTWRIVTKQYQTFHKMEGWVNIYTAEKAVAQAQMNMEQAVLAIVYPDKTVEFFSIRSGRKMRAGSLW